MTEWIRQRNDFLIATVGAQVGVTLLVLFLWRWASSRWCRSASRAGRARSGCGRRWGATQSQVLAGILGARADTEMGSGIGAGGAVLMLAVALGQGPNRSAEDVPLFAGYLGDDIGSHDRPRASWPASGLPAARSESTPPTPCGRHESPAVVVRTWSNRPAHQAKRGCWTDQRPARDNTIHDPVISAKPPFPVQIRAAPPNFRGSNPTECAPAAQTGASQLDYAGPNRRRPRGGIAQITVCEALRCSRVGTGRRFRGPPTSRGRIRDGASLRTSRPASSITAKTRRGAGRLGRSPQGEDAPFIQFRTTVMRSDRSASGASNAFTRKRPSAATS